MPENSENKKESIVLPDDLDRVNKDHLDLGNEKLVNEALREMATDTIPNIGELNVMFRRLDERAKELIFEQKDSQEIIEQLVREEHERRKTELGNMGRNVKTGREEAIDPQEEAQARKQYYQEQKAAQAFDKHAFEYSQPEVGQTIDEYVESINETGREIEDFENERREAREAELASDRDVHKYSSVAPTSMPEGKIEAVKARKRQEEQAIAGRNKEIKQARAEQAKLAREVDQMKYGANDEWTNQRLDLEAELSEKSNKRKTAHTIGYTRREMEKFGIEKPEEYAQRVKNERSFRQSTISTETGENMGVLTPEEYSRREQNRQVREEYARTGKDPRFEDPVNVQEEAPEGNPYKSHLDTMDAQALELQTFSEDKLADWTKKLDKWKAGKEGLVIEDIRREFPREALEAFDTIGYQNLSPEMRRVWSKVGAAWDTHERKLGLRNGDKEAYNDGVGAREFVAADSADRTAFIRANKAYHREVVQAREDIATRMEKIKHSDDPKLLLEYNTLARYRRELEKQDAYTLDSVRSMEGYQHNSDKLAEMNRAFVAGNLSIGEYLASPVVVGYRGFNMTRHSYGVWERNALLENQQNNSGFARWSKDKMIKTPRALAYAGVGIPIAAVAAAGALIWGAWKVGKFTWKTLKQAPAKGEQINKKIDKALGEDMFKNMFK